MKTGPCEWGSTVWITKCFPTTDSSVCRVPPLPLSEGCGDSYQVPGPPTSNQPSWGLLRWVGPSPSPFLLSVLFSSTCAAHVCNHRRRPRPRPRRATGHTPSFRSRSAFPVSVSPRREARPGTGRSLAAEFAGAPTHLGEWAGAAVVAPWHPGRCPRRPAGPVQVNQRQCLSDCSQLVTEHKSHQRVNVLFCTTIKTNQYDVPQMVFYSQ